MYWNISQFFYILAIIILIIAIILAIWYGTLSDETINAGSKHRINIPIWFFLGSISLGILAFVQQNYENMHDKDIITGFFNKKN